MMMRAITGFVIKLFLLLLLLLFDIMHLFMAFMPVR
jgi:hypothetical protein